MSRLCDQFLEALPTAFQAAIKKNAIVDEWWMNCPTCPSLVYGGGGVPIGQPYWIRLVGHLLLPVTLLSPTVSALLIWTFFAASLEVLSIYSTDHRDSKVFHFYNSNS